MTETAVIYKTDGVSYDHIVAMLQAQDYDAVAMSDPDSGALYFPGSNPYIKIPPVVYIAVPGDQRTGAEIALKKHLHESARRVSKIAGNTPRDAIKASACGLLVIFSTYLYGCDFDVSILSGVAAFMLMFILFISVSHRTDKK